MELQKNNYFYRLFFAKHFMFEFISGKIRKLTPASVVLENGGIGYFISISLNTYGFLNDHSECKLYIHQVIREDANMLFGFYNEKEREIFRLLISVSGVGANTARMMLSSLTGEELEQAILRENVAVLKAIKGIGAKTAQRIIVDLKDKIGKSVSGGEIFISASNTIVEEALSALIALGFARNSSQKVVSAIVKKESGLTVEQLIKKALKQM